MQQAAPDGSGALATRLAGLIDMWIVRSSPASPFGRKVRVAADICGFADTVSVERSDTSNPDDTIRSQNPLGKIPALVLEDGTVLYNSAVILEFFDFEAGGGRIIPAGRERFEVLTQQALADGIMEAALLIVYEGRFREPGMHSEKWLENQHGKIARALDAFEAEAPSLDGPAPNAAAISLGCALGYLDFRLNGAWRAAHPKLVAWLADLEKRVPAFAATAPS